MQPFQLVTSRHQLFLNLMDLFAETSKNATLTSYKPQNLMTCSFDSKETLLQTHAFLAFKQASRTKWRNICLSAKNFNQKSLQPIYPHSGGRKSPVSFGSLRLFLDLVLLCFWIKWNHYLRCDLVMKSQCVFCLKSAIFLVLRLRNGPCLGIKAAFQPPTHGRLGW